MLCELGIDSKVFEACHGNEVQQKVHKEFASITDLSSMIYEKARSANVKELIDCAVDFAATGSVINQQGDISKALASADCSWSLLNCTKALLKVDCDIALGAYEGVEQGVGNVAHMVANPAETIVNIVKTIDVAGNCVGKLVHEVVTADSDLAFTAPEYYEKLCQEKIEKLDAVIEFLDHVAENVKKHQRVMLLGKL